MENPNYWAILPSRIRYAKDLTLLQKILFAEITALSNKEGYCWASNDYFASLYDKNPDYISTTINDMAKKGYLIIQIENFNQRKIWARVEENLEGGLEKPKGGIEKSKTPPLEKSKHNNIKINNIKKYNEEITALEIPSKFTKRSDITNEVLQELADKHQVPHSFVFDCWDTACNWLDAKGKRQKNYKAFLENWVKRDKANWVLKTKQLSTYKRGVMYAEE